MIKTLIEDLKIILAPAEIAGIGGHHDLWLYHSCAHDYSLANYQRADLIRSKLADCVDFGFCKITVNDENIAT